ncbi:hypothetical protein K402DRAFT_460978 [Aulographum hederae CBS 113979]|uniref:uS12 prolyl 3,4-dihydroxylase n=1 Tax=Aulographum hederae CBS 113979 TaxID=1176131 RepID=A0A6G1H8S6_9PEZI|nr:hypothetical protein K402DRAFT_460978 [Aulographum hederae CBS 113979]
MATTNGSQLKRKAEDESLENPSAKKHQADAAFANYTPNEQDLHVRGKCYPTLFDQNVFQGYRQQYANSQPYKHGVIKSLIEPNLLRSVRNEIRDNLSFTAKETDIYKIFQSGDLANLDGLEDSALKRLPSMIELRNVMYSAEFRRYISGVTNSGPLSGTKTDMAINVYTPGCHLLCHDDVIGSRRVSYILYLTDPDTPWKPEWGGALRLYPTEQFKSEDGTTMKSPSPKFNVSIPPAFNQLAFFVVQPGESFHDVEEVYKQLEGEKDDRMRMAISGWFHLPQEGEEGYEEGKEEELAHSSSLAQLQSKADELDLPQPSWQEYAVPDSVEDEGDEAELTESELQFLIEYMRPQYLTPDVVDTLAEMFDNESSLQLGEFLSKSFSARLRTYLEAAEKLPDETGFTTARPPHKHRFLYRQPSTSGKSAATPYSDLINIFLPSHAFKKWLALATGGVVLTKSNILARRFRSGQDYTLATSYDDPEPQLEICLGITPTKGWEADSAEDGKLPTAPAGEEKKMWDAIVATKDSTVGGYEMYMAPDDDDEVEEEEEGVATAADGKPSTNNPKSNTGAGNRPAPKKPKLDPAVYRSGSSEDEDDGVLFSMPACWNSLSVVLRDRGVLKFVKYVSKAAKGDRWDICGEFGVRFEEADGVVALGNGGATGNGQGVPRILADDGVEDEDEMEEFEDYDDEEEEYTEDEE